MGAERKTGQRKSGHWPWTTAARIGVSALMLAGAGCVGFWDEVTSRNRDMKGYFHPPAPTVVLQNSSDGARRAKALRELPEPMQHGGTAKDQEAYIALMTRSAQQDFDPLVRLGAIRALAKSHDPRAVAILENAYYQAPTFTPEITSIVRQHVLSALEQTGNPDARQLLLRIAGNEVEVTGTSQDQQQVLDERLTALRGLARFKQYDVTETLVRVLEREKDIALRDRAHRSLQAVTGKHLPPDAQAWRDFLSDPKNNHFHEPNVIQRVVDWWND
jgi:hypothetical protein